MEFESSLTFSQKPIPGLNSEQYQSSYQSLTLCIYFLWKQVQTSECLEWLGWGVGDRESEFDSRDGLIGLYYSEVFKSVMWYWVDNQDNIKQIVWFMTNKCI